MEEKYEYLKKYVVKTSDKLLTSTGEEIEKVRNQIIQTHRTIILFPMINSQFNIFISFQHKKSQLEKFVIDPEEAAPPRISPQLIQQSSHLLSFIHSKTADLIDAVIEFKDQELFYWLINSSIPSLFGYFSSPEHLQLAFSFYMRVLTSAPKNLGPIILKPFFDSPAIYRFIESVFQPFFEKLFRDSRFETSKSKFNDLVSFYARDLSKLIMQSSCLLHSSHSVILKFMKEQWNTSETVEFIINIWLKSHAMQWLRADGHMSRINVVDEVFNYINKSKELISSILDKLCYAEPQFELPDMYTTFDQPYLMFYSSFMDLSLLAKVISLKCELSPAMTIFLSEHPLKYHMFWFKIFPKRPMPHSFSQRRMVFHEKAETIEENPDFDRLWRQVENSAEENEMEPYDFLNSSRMEKAVRSFGEGFMDYAFSLSINHLVEAADNFETFLNYKLSLSMIEKWLSITVINLEKHLRTYASYVVLPEILNNLKQGQEFSFEESAKLFYHYNYAKECMFFTYLETKMIPSVVKKYQKAIDELVSVWTNYFSNLGIDSSTDIGLKSSIANTMFYDAAERLLDINTESLMTSLMAIFKILKLLNDAAKYDNVTNNLFEAAIRVNPKVPLPLVYILINEFAMKNKSFNSLLTDKERKLWVSFESVLLKLIIKDQRLVIIFFPLQQNIEASLL